MTSVETDEGTLFPIGGIRMVVRCTLSSKLEHHKQGEDMASKDKIIDKIEKKIDSN